jgi:hypothetical protein
VGVDIDYKEPFGFYDADEFEVRCKKVRLRRKGTQIECFFDFIGAGKTFIDVRILFRVVAVSDDPSLSAEPSQLDGDLLGKFEPHEIEEATPPRVVPELVARIEAEGSLLAEGQHTFVVHRHLCELADQWSYIELPGLVEVGRERLVISKGEAIPDLRKSLSRPLSTFNAELSRPFFLFDEGEVTSRAYRLGERVALVHRVTNRNRWNAQAALVVEQF